MTLNPFKWWRNYKERKRLKAELASKAELDQPCSCTNCTCMSNTAPEFKSGVGHEVNRGGLVRSPASSRVIGGSGYVPSPSRRVIGGSRHYSRSYREEPVIGVDCDLIDPVDALIAAQIITNNFGQDDQSEPKGGFTIPEAPARIEPAYFDSAPKDRNDECGSTGSYEAPVAESRVEECGSTGCFDSEPDSPDTDTDSDSD